jgi:hypothetical protein
MPRTLLTTFTLLVLAACAAERDATPRRVAGDPKTVAERLGAELARLGFRWRGTTGGIEATAGNVPADWAACPPVLVGGGDDRRQMASAGQRRGSVRIDLAAAGDGGTSVTLAARFTASYRNGITGYAFERACRSSGVVEASLVAAAAAS